MQEKTISAAAADASASPSWVRKWLHVHKPGEAMPTRLGLFLVLFGFVLFTCHHWFYNWQFLQKFVLRTLDYVKLGVLVEWSAGAAASQVLQIGGALLLGAVLAGAAYYYIYIKVKSAEFLVQTDAELRKVTWPEVEPWFKPQAKLWGETYLVLIVVAALAIYVFGIDFLLNFLAQEAFYR